LLSFYFVKPLDLSRIELSDSTAGDAERRRDLFELGTTPFDGRLAASEGARLRVHAALDARLDVLSKAAPGALARARVREGRPGHDRRRPARSRVADSRAGICAVKMPRFLNARVKKRTSLTTCTPPS